MDWTEKKFVDFTDDISFADLTHKAIHAIKRSVVDSIGCAYGGFNAAPVKALRGLASRITSVAPATVIGTTIRSVPDLTAFTNSAMVRYLDFSDDYLGEVGIGPHPSDTIGGVLAAAESVGADGKGLLLGIGIAYEADGQMVDSIRLNGKQPGFDYPVFHAIATSLGAGKVMRLSRDQLRDALALSVVPNNGLGQTRHGALSNWKGLRGPNGTRNGLFAAILAREGITGPAEPFEGKDGLAKLLDQKFDMPEFGGKTIPFKVEGTFFKGLPVRYNAQLPIWAALELMKKISLEDVDSVCLHLIGRYAFSKAENPEFWDPTTRETADHSLPYLIGAAMVDGDITLKTFTPARYRDPRVLSVVQKIRLEEDKAYTAAAPKTINCRIEATLKSGKVESVYQTNPRGHPTNPMTDDELVQKFMKQASPLLPMSQCEAILDQLWSLEKIKDLQKLLASMVVPG
jgi:2-methylcitrate dehydratase